MSQSSYETLAVRALLRKWKVRYSAASEGSNTHNLHTEYLNKFFSVFFKGPLERMEILHPLYWALLPQRTKQKILLNLCINLQ